MKLKTSETGQVNGFQLCFVVHDMYSRFVIRELMKFTSLLFTNSGIVDFHVPIIAASTVFFKSIRCVAINYGFFLVSQSSHGESMDVMWHQIDLRITRSVITLALV
jgi:hypothetical protein